MGTRNPSHPTSVAIDSAINAALREPRGSPAPFDGVAELWWDDEDAFTRAMTGRDARRAARELVEDERRFIDFAHSPIWLATEDEIIVDPGQAPRA